MKFEEKDAIELDYEIKPHIYFLLLNEEVVYVGKTKKGQYKSDEMYDSIYIIYCKEDELDYLHDKYIKKYNPEYNTHMNYAINYSLTRARNKIRERYNTSSFTIKDLKKFVKALNINLYVCDQQVCMNVDDYKKIIKCIDERVERTRCEDNEYK